MAGYLGLPGSLTWQLNPPDNNVLIRSGEALGIGWSRIMLYSGFNIYIALSFVGELGSPLG